MKAMTRSQLAARAGVSVDTLCRWLRAHPELDIPKRALIPPDKAKKICELYDID